MQTQLSFFNRLGVYGFGQVEPLVIAALVSEDPVLLIGKAGTGKTFLLNSISEAMGLEHRHYNASLISFDDLVGFPYPSADGKSISFLPTPATIWEAQSVLVDELSRCKPETQNKFFSVVHEKKIQGMPLHKLQYRWAAMNPIGLEADADEQYEGSNPLDQALADRFAMIIEVPDWPELSTRDQEAVIYPAGEAALSYDAGSLSVFINRVKPVFEINILHPHAEIVTYARLATTLMTEAGYRISPRRARLLARNMTALNCVAKEMGNNLAETERKTLYKLVLRCSLPHRAWKGPIPEHIIDAVHAEAARLAFSGSAKDLWISEFLLAGNLKDKVPKLFDETIDIDTKSLAVIQLLAREQKANAAIFSFCTYPIVSEYLMLNEEALNELARSAKGILKVDGELKWRESYHDSGSNHPCWTVCMQTINKMPDADESRKKRARQLFLYLITQNIAIPEPDFVEEEMNNCFNTVKTYAAQLTNNENGKGTKTWLFKWGQ